MELLSHGYICLAADPQLRLVFQITDIIIWLSYCVISVTLFIMSKGTRLRRDVIYLEFIVFIFLCGQTHLMDVFNKLLLTSEAHSWIYWIDGYFIRIATAFASAITAAVLLTIRKPLQEFFKKIPPVQK